MGITLNWRRKEQEKCYPQRRETMGYLSGRIGFGWNRNGSRCFIMVCLGQNSQQLQNPSFTPTLRQIKNCFDPFVLAAASLQTIIF
jgi:hypothetical protein